MAIPYLAIQQAVLSKLDAEGSDYYRDDLDIIPALNLAQSELITALNSKLGAKKFSEEYYRGLIKNRIYQSSNYARIQLDQGPIQVWGIISVVVGPQLGIPPSATPATYSPLAAPLGQSVYNPNYVYLNGGSACRRLNAQERYSNQGNPFEAGFVSSNPSQQNISYGYISFQDYAGAFNSAFTYEIELLPHNSSTISQPVAISFVAYPTQIVNTTDTLDWDPVATDLLTNGTLRNIAYKQGDQTTIWKVTDEELQLLLSQMLL